MSHFSRDLLPLAVALLFDTSLSVQPYMPVLQIAAGSALRQLKPEDQVALFSFNAYPERICDLTQDRVLIAKEIGQLKFRLGTDIYDTIHDAARYLRNKAPNRRRAIIVVSDNCHILFGNSNHSAESARTEALEAGATVYSIKTPGDNPAPVCFQSVADVKQITADTGGETLDVQSWGSLQEVLNKAISNLRMQ